MARNRPALQGLPTRQGGLTKSSMMISQQYIAVQVESSGETPGKLLHRCRRKTAPAPRLAWDIRRITAAGALAMLK
jgi:hypothetical protein